MSSELDCTAPCAIAGQTQNICEGSGCGIAPCRLPFSGSPTIKWQCYAYVSNTRSCDGIFGTGSTAPDCSSVPTSAPTPTPEPSPSPSRTPAPTSRPTTNGSPTTGSSNGLGQETGEEGSKSFFSSTGGIVVISVIAILGLLVLVLSFLFWRRNRYVRRSSDLSSTANNKWDRGLHNGPKDEREQALLESGDREQTPAYYQGVHAHLAPQTVAAVVPTQQYWTSVPVTAAPPAVAGRGSDYSLHGSSLSGQQAAPQRMSLSEKIKELQEQKVTMLGTGAGAVPPAGAALDHPNITERLLPEVNQRQISTGTVDIDDLLVANEGKGDSMGTIDVDGETGRYTSASDRQAPGDVMNIDLYRLSRRRSSTASSMEL